LLQSCGHGSSSNDSGDICISIIIIIIIIIITIIMSSSSSSSSSCRSAKRIFILGRTDFGLNLLDETSKL
jgi:uncharacterized protein (DUF983 family)